MKTRSVTIRMPIDLHARLAESEDSSVSQVVIAVCRRYFEMGGSSMAEQGTVPMDAGSSPVLPTKPEEGWEERFILTKPKPKAPVICGFKTSIGDMMCGMPKGHMASGNLRGHGDWVKV